MKQELDTTNYLTDLDPASRIAWGRTVVHPYKGLLVRFAELCNTSADHRRTQQLDSNPNAALTEQTRQNISSLSDMNI